MELSVVIKVIFAYLLTTETQLNHQSGTWFDTSRKD